MADRGAKRRCSECGAAFYDLGRKPIVCPKCGATHEPQVLLKSDGRTPRKSRDLPPPPPKPEPEPESGEDAPPEGGDDEEDEDVLPEEDEDETGPPEEPDDESERER